MSKEERITKVIARAGLCSRREAERWIKDGRVQVNGAGVDAPVLVNPDTDKIEIDGKALPRQEKTRLFLHHKPGGLVTTNKDEQGRKTVFDELPKALPRVMSVGRLDMNTEGLLLLTNDGDLSRYLELPSTGWKRRYRVRVHGNVSEGKLRALENGMVVEGVRYQSIEAKIDKNMGANCWLSVVLTEGKNREIRRVMEALGLEVNRLIRTSYGPFNLDKLPKGAVQEIKGKVMKEQIAGFFKERS